MKQFDLQAVKRRFERVAHTYDQYAYLCEDIASRLASRLACVKLSPTHCVDVGCGTGIMTRALGKLYPSAKITGVDFSPRMLQTFKVATGMPTQLASAHVLPFPDQSIDLVVSNLMLPFVNTLSPVFSEVKRVLKPEGIFLFSSFGPDTFWQLRAAWAAVDDMAHVQVFLDMHDVGDALLAAGFGDPVMDVERVTVKYKTVDSLLREIKNVGFSNLLQARAKGLTGKARWQAFIREFMALCHATPQLSLELIFSYAINLQSVQNDPTEQHFSLAALRQTLRDRSY